MSIEDEEDQVRIAAREIISVSGEVSRLQLALAQHTRAAIGLDSATNEISALAGELRRLPEPFLVLLGRGDDFVERASVALKPVSEISSVLHGYGEALQDQSKALEAFVPLSELVRTTAKKASEESQEISNDLAQAQEALVTLQGGVEKLQVTLEALLAKVAGASQVAERRAEEQKLEMMETSEKLLRLERLAKRSLLAILMGKSDEAR